VAAVVEDDFSDEDDFSVVVLSFVAALSPLLFSEASAFFRDSEG
jgi:hypothetical protein